MSEAYETLRGRKKFKRRAFARHDKNNAKSFRERVRQCLVHQVHLGTAPESPGSVPGAAWGIFWPVPGRSWPAPDVPRSVLEPFFGVPDPSRARPGAFPKRLRAPKTAQNRFCVDFSSILVPFSSIFERFFRRILLEQPATKAENPNLTKELRDLHHASWLLRGAVASYCSHICRNDFRTLHARLYFIAYPQAHLVS